MEKFTKTVKKKNLDKFIFNCGLAGTYVTSMKEEGDKVSLTLQRDLSKEQYKKILDRVKLYKKSNVLSIVPLFVFISISVIFLTTFIVLMLNVKDKNFEVINYLCFLFPGLILFLVSAIYSMVRIKSINSYIFSGKKIRDDIEAQVKKEILEHQQSL